MCKHCWEKRYCYVLTLSHILHICSRRLWKLNRKKYGKSLKVKVYLLKKVENFVTKGKIARFEQFLFMPQCFQKSSTADALESVYIWESFVFQLCFPKSYKFMLSLVCIREMVYPFPFADASWHKCSRQLLKTLWLKEKLLMTSNLYFCYYVFWLLYNI